ncbi:MAG: hypothetical protein ACOCPV_03755, partial [Halodesulfurarchaeum sp.]
FESGPTHPFPSIPVLDFSNRQPSAENPPLGTDHTEWKMDVRVIEFEKSTHRVLLEGADRLFI